MSLLVEKDLVLTTIERKRVLQIPIIRTNLHLNGQKRIGPGWVFFLQILSVVDFDTERAHLIWTSVTHPWAYCGPWY